MSVALAERPLTLDDILGPRWRDLAWRLDNLYWIVDEHGKAVEFHPNEEQRDFIANLHTRNIILKARQLGFSTLMQVLELDQALFNANHNGVVIADTLPNAGKLFAKVEFAYGRLAESLKRALPLKSQASKSSLEFEHGSTIYVSTSSRGGTVQLLHVSELGKIARKFPERAAEIVSGAFESVPQDGVIVVESTAEGAAGEFFELVDTALKRQAEDAPETPLDWRLHFYAWYKKAAYRLDPALVTVADKDHQYFDKLQAELGITIDSAQRAWYLVSLEWFVGRKSSEPMMVIQSARGGIDAGALGICLSSIGNYADPSGGPAEGAEARCWLELGNLGRAPLAIEARLLLDVILQFTPHLIAMPPAPIDVRRRESAGPLLEVEHRANGRTVQRVTI